MHPALDQLQKVLHLEAQNGYPNKAIIGGLPKMLSFWEPTARRGGLEPAIIGAIVEQIRAYPDQAEAERAAAVQAMLGLIREADNAASSAAPKAAGPSSASQSRPTAPRPAVPPPSRPAPEP